MRDKTLLLSVFTACSIHALALFLNFDLSRASPATTPALEVTLVAAQSAPAPPGPVPAPTTPSAPASVPKQSAKPKVELKPSRPVKPKPEPKPIHTAEPEPLPLPEPSPSYIQPEPPPTNETVTEEVAAVSTEPSTFKPTATNVNTGSGVTEAVSDYGIDDAANEGGVSGIGQQPGGKGGKDGFGATIGGSMPAYAHNPKPEYPPAARRNGQQGKTMLLVEVLSSGHVGKVKIERSSGYEILDEAAVEAVRKWKFVPAKKGRNSVSAWVRIPIEFSLTD